MTKESLVPNYVWTKIRDEIAPQLISEGQALMTADEDNVEVIFDEIRKLDIRIDNLLNEFLIVPRSEAERYKAPVLEMGRRTNK
jgi:hypothetical protein